MNIITVNDYAQDIVDAASLVMEHVSATATQTIALQAANKLFLQLKTLKTLAPPAYSLEQLQQELIHDIQCFEQTLKLSGIPAMLVLVYRYLLCTVMDEAILASDWGKQHLWSQHSLLTIFHQDNQGGEKFFILLDKLQQFPQRNLAVLEFIYFCLSLGFAGKYQLQPNGLQQLETLRQQLYVLIRQQQVAAPVSLSTNYQPPIPAQDRSNTTLVPLILVLLLTASVFFTCKWILAQQATPVLHALQALTRSYVTSSRMHYVQQVN